MTEAAAAPGPPDPLVARALAGDARAVGELMVRNLPQLEAFLRLRVGEALRRKESISDLVQSVCAAALADLDAFEFRGEPQFRHWLFKQALHKVVNKHEYYRAQKRDMGRELSPPSAPAGASSSAGDDRLLQHYASICTPSRHAAGREELQRIETAFDQLPEDYREAITLQRLIGLEYGEIAESMQRSEGAVRNLVYRGLSRLSALLGA